MFAVDEQPEEFKKQKQKGQRVDHSKVHFQNERLAENLHTNLNQLSSEEHRQMLNSIREINEIKDEIHDFKIIQDASDSKTSSKKNPRPHTSSAYICRRGKSPKTFSVSKPPEKIRIPHINDEADESSDNSDDSSFIDDDPFSKKRAKSAPAPKADAVHRNNKTNIPGSRKPLQRNGASVNRGQRNAFTKRYTPSPAFYQATSKVPTALDASNKRPRSTLSLKSFGLSATRGLSAKTNASSVYRSTRPQSATASVSTTWSENVEDVNPRRRRLNVMCERTPTVLSRRQLRAMTNVDRLIEERKSTNPREVLLEINRRHTQELEQRVRHFVESLERLKKKEMEKQMLRALKIKETFD